MTVRNTFLGNPYHIANDEAPCAPVGDSVDKAYTLAYFMSSGPYLHVSYLKSCNGDRSFSVRESLCVRGEIKEDETGTECPDNGSSL